MPHISLSQHFRSRFVYSSYLGIVRGAFTFVRVRESFTKSAPMARVVLSIKTGFTSNQVIRINAINRIFATIALFRERRQILWAKFLDGMENILQCLEPDIQQENRSFAVFSVLVFKVTNDGNYPRVFSLLVFQRS